MGSTTWGRKNIEGELQQVRGHLQEERQRNARLEEDLRRLQAENSKMRQQLEIQQDRDQLLLELQRSSVSEVGGGSFRVGDGSFVAGNQASTRPRVCSSICALFG